MTRATYDTWLKSSQGLSLTDDTLVVGVPSAYAKDWIEQRLEPTVRSTVAEIHGRSLDCRFIVAEAGAEPASRNGHATHSSTALAEAPRFEQPALAERPGPAPAAPRLNPRYTFDSFVVGGSNRMAQAAAQAVAEHPATQYNPLFIYGGVGLGKTHLLHAIGHEALARGRQVLAVSSETFTNDLINAIRGHATEEFRAVYRAADVLLIDDIHFIAGKESTQEEFFHTFNTVYGGEGQIVLTSDRPPQAIATLEERLRSRFQWGLLVDVEPPDLETRIAILRGKNEQLSTPLPEPMIELIAQSVPQNVRELEGALIRVGAFAQIHHLPLNVDTARKALADLLLRREAPELDQVVDAVADYYGIDKGEIVGRRRSASVAEPRQVAMYLMRAETDASYPAIGQAIGGRDHTTILHGCEKITRLVERDANLRRDIMRIRERLYGA